jgi:RNA polymerase sigma-70 factor (ECF subfamily)
MRKASERNESKLVARAVKGSADSFGDLYEMHISAIYRYILYRVADPQDARELADEVFLKAWSALSGYRPGETPFRAWLYRIAHNLVIDHYRSRREVEPLGDRDLIADSQPNPERQLVQREEEEDLARNISRLPPDYQQVLVLRYIEGLSTSQVAAILKRSDGAVRVLLHRALKKLTKLMVKEERFSG